MLCSRCASENPPESAFCSRCGAPLAGSAGSVQSEIKQATALCAELVLEARKEDPEVLHTLLSRFLDLAREETDRFGGTLSQILGRGVLALFGVPVAHEDHPERAVLAGAALRQRIERAAQEVERSYGVAWSVRMGLDTGAVVTGGTGATAVGEATASARRLLAAAAPGAILLSDAVASRVRGQVRIRASDRLPDPASGHLRPVWCLADGAPSFSAPRRSPDGRLSPFVGRDREMTLLEELRRQALEGQGQVVGIAGEPGSGKSRLLYELAAGLSGLSASHLRGHCLSYASGIPYFPLLDMIRGASRIGPTDGPSAVAAKLRRSLGRVGVDVERTLPHFLRVLGLEEEDGALVDMEPRAVKARTLEAMRRMVLTASRRSLVVMEVEDLHWIDDTSEEFLTSLIEEMAGARLLLLLTYRSGYQPGWLQKTFATQITMRRLSAADSRVVVDSILGGGAPAEQRRDVVVERAQGNPFFLEELAKALTDETGDGGARTPETVQGVLMARIDRLPEAHKHVLQVGSVLDRDLSLDLLGALWDRPEPLPELLAELQQWEFLNRSPSDDAIVYSFRHALTQEVAYQSLLKSRRRRLHARVAKALETLYADRLEDVYDRLTYHYPRADDSERTVRYLLLFAERAAQHYAHAEAAKALREALEHAGRLPEEHRDRTSIEIVLRLAESLLPLARLPETLEVSETYREAMQRLDDPSLEARFRFWLAHTYTYLGHQEESRREAELAIAAAQASGDEATEGRGWYVLGRNAFWAGEFSAGLEQSQRAVVLLERSGEPWWQGQAYWVAGFHHWALGEFDRALEALLRASEIGEALDDYRLDSSWSVGFVQASLGNWQAGIDYCLRAIERSRDPLNSAVATGFLGFAHLQKGDVEAALRCLREAIQRLAEAGMRQLLGWLTAFLGEAYLAADRIEEGRDAASEALQVSRDARFDYGVGLAQRVLGRALLAAGQTGDGARELREALETFRRLGAPFEEARTHLALAGAGGGPDGAEDHRAEAHRLFRELKVPAYVGQADALTAGPRAEDAAVSSS